MAGHHIVTGGLYTRVCPEPMLFVRLAEAVFTDLPHNRFLNGFFYTLTFIFKGGAAWYGLLAVVVLRAPQRGWRVARHIAVPLALSSATVEFPVKTYVRRPNPLSATCHLPRSSSHAGSDVRCDHEHRL